MAIQICQGSSEDAEAEQTVLLLGPFDFPHEIQLTPLDTTTTEKS